MRLRIRRDKNRLATQRRSSRFMRGIRNRFESFKLRMAFGRRAVIHWWDKKRGKD